MPEAVEHYRIVAKGGGEYGKAATTALAKIEMPTNPGAYLSRRCDADSRGNLVVSVKNETSLPVRDVVFVVQYADSAGRQQQVRQAVPGSIAPGQVASVNTGLGPYTPGASCPAQVVAARIDE